MNELGRGFDDDSSMAKAAVTVFVRAQLNTLLD